MLLKKLLTISCGLMLMQYSSAATCNTISDGDFSDSSIWSCGSVPGKSDNVNVYHNVNFDVNFTGGGGVKGDWFIDSGASLSGTANLDITSSGTLTVNGNLQVHDLEFDNGSVIIFNSGSTIVITGDLTNNNNSDEVTVNSLDFTVLGDLNNGVGSEILGSGTIDVEGNFNNASSGTVFGCVGAECDCVDCFLCAACGPLPIELISQKVQNIEDDVKIEWTTASEHFNDRFIISKSQDGTNFDYVGTIPGQGNSSSIINYEYTDLSVNANKIFYRISDIDYDGVITHHPLLYVVLDRLEESIIITNNYIEISNLENEDIEIDIYDTNGKLYERSHFKNVEKSFRHFVHFKGIILIRINFLDRRKSSSFISVFEDN